MQLYALSQNEVRDNSDRMFIQEEFANIQHLTDKQFTYDACCDDFEINSHCAAYSSLSNSFLHCNVANQHVWLHAPFAKLEQFI